MKQEQKNKSKDPPRISERQIDKQARQTKCQDHTTADTVRESLSTPHQSLGGGIGQSSVETRSTSIATRKITRYSSAAFKSTSWELIRQSSEKFLRVAGVGLVHTLGGPGRHEDFSPRLYFTYIYIYIKGIEFVVYNVGPANNVYAPSGRHCEPHSFSIK